MKKIFFYLAIYLLSTSLVFSQKSDKVAYKINYKQFSNGNYQEDRDFSIRYFDNICYLSEDDATIKQYIDFNRRINTSVISYNDSIFRTQESFDSLRSFSTNKDTTIIINGLDCKLATYNSFSNSIEVYYTTDLSVKGSPYSSFLPDKNSLVAKIVINGNRSIVFDEIHQITIEDLPEYPFDKSKEINAAEFEELKILSRYEILSVFKNERINFDTKLEKVTINDSLKDITFRTSNGGVILKKIKLPEIAKSGAYCYARLNVKSDGDAYDRTGSVFIINGNNPISSIDAFNLGPDVLPTFSDKSGQEYQGYLMTDKYEPPSEIMRFFTSFGAGHFNNLRPINNYDWEDEILYKQEITSLIPTDADEIWIGVFIGNYDKNGHIVSLDLDFYPAWDNELENIKRYIKSLFNTVNIMEMSGQNYCRLFKTDTLEVEFYIPDNITNPQLVFTTTGHGGWENGDEFVPKRNQILIDGEIIFEIVPWRTDCATYRLGNPASGNFSNGLSSSDLSRSNWCPGTLTPPYFIPLDKLSKGKHKMQVVIDQGEDEGSSFSSWSVSGTLIGQIKNIN